MTFKYIDKVCEVNEPLFWNSAKSKLMIDACREMAEFQYQNNQVVRHIFDKKGFKPESVVCEESLAEIPSIGVTAMKHHLLTTLPHDQAALKLTSSGTRGQKTQIWMDQDSLDRCQRMLDVYLSQEGLISQEKTNYLVLNYDPDDAGDLGIAYTEKNQLRFAPVNDSYYAVKKDREGNWFFDKQKALEKLQAYAEQNHDVRIFGLPAFLFEFIEFLSQEKVKPFSFGQNSLILTGGGWKAAEDKKISRDEFRNLCEKWFGIPKNRQRDGYGMAEHCAPYFECRDHKFHVPVYCRLVIRDPVTLKVSPPGEKGIMELITPFNTMMPTLALLTTDYGRLNPEPCSCGWTAPTFELLGRAGVSKHKGCALTANDVVRRTQ